ncbi:single-stranded DNA-binding protein [Porphyromonadaceae bacterium W3.11]|nr:single-stranded DNA-binding protein [Porphyromonadaceae bacterium W3.11]
MNNLTENKVSLVGHVGADPKIKYLDQNTCTAMISLATDAEGTINEEGVMVRGMVTDWHSILCYRELAELVDKTVGVGDLIEVEGRLTYLKLKSGLEKRYKAVVLAQKVNVIKKKEYKKANASLPEEDIHQAYGEYLDTLSEDPDNLPF